jgi:hypothetical protein
MPAASAGQHQGRHEAVVAVRVQDVQRERAGRPRVGEHHAQAGPAEAPPDLPQQGEAGQVERDGGGVRRVQRIPRPAPRQGLLERDVGGVGHRAVGVAVLVVVGERAPEVEPVAQPVTADHAGVAHVDDVGVDDVEGQAEADEEDEDPGQHAHADQRPGRGLQRVGPAQAEPQHPAQQVQERRIGERDRDADPGVVEEGD